MRIKICMVKNQDKEKAYIMAQGPSAITSIGIKNTSNTHNIIDDNDTYG